MVLMGLIIAIGDEIFFACLSIPLDDAAIFWAWKDAFPGHFYSCNAEFMSFVEHRLQYLFLWVFLLLVKVEFIFAFQLC